jgi:hypothetical protein
VAIKKGGSRAVACAYSVEIFFIVFSQWIVDVEEIKNS